MGAADAFKTQGINVMMCPAYRAQLNSYCYVTSKKTAKPAIARTAFHTADASAEGCVSLWIINTVQPFQPFLSTCFCLALRRRISTCQTVGFHHSSSNSNSGKLFADIVGCSTLSLGPGGAGDAFERATEKEVLQVGQLDSATAAATAQQQ